MIKIPIPGFNENLNLEYLVLDYNGTLAVEGILHQETIPRLKTLSEILKIFVITADTFGSAQQQLETLPVELIILPSDNQAVRKLNFIENLNSDKVVAIGNGKNDTLMLKESALGIAIIGNEGLATSALLAADIVCKHITDALDMLIHPKRIVATLRN